ncbi:hypothetical protein BDK51DRAFT_49074 [Blyttiomyces helicus]|uniref:Uncharacterized protein n=1 Tax=Blyttiomyces helicus TaxID=388810 RepID=A0A4P9VX80_9FUNG|nr:hypothetical protein BDK51DRAFT_49074 [Blyttiomyces helicus]|eukprot:RKO84329.1 hypothetical protein BDK51DRAFT_49074 [Blyttiomyces helicus]
MGEVSWWMARAALKCPSRTISDDSCRSNSSAGRLLKCEAFCLVLASCVSRARSSAAYLTRPAIAQTHAPTPTSNPSGNSPAVDLPAPSLDPLNGPASQLDILTFDPPPFNPPRNRCVRGCQRHDRLVRLWLGRRILSFVVPYRIGLQPSLDCSHRRHNGSLCPAPPPLLARTQSRGSSGLIPESRVVGHLEPGATVESYINVCKSAGQYGDGSS